MKMFACLTCFVLLLGLGSSASAVLVTETFDTQPAWTESDPGNYIPTPWYKTSNNAGGASAGELGGPFYRNISSTHAYVADTASLGTIDETMPLVIKGNYVVAGGGTSDRPCELYMGYMDATAKQLKLLYLRLINWSNTTTYTGYVRMGSTTAVNFNASSGAVIGVDLSYTYNSGTSEGTVTGTITGTTTGTINVNTTAVVPAATANAFGMFSSAKNDGHNQYRNVYVDDLTYGVVPEPATVAILGLGSVVLLRRRRA
jgi:hypothetical protein